MSYTIRNTIILVGLFIIVIIGTILVNAKPVKKLEELEKSNKEKSTVLETINRTHPDLANEEKLIEESLENMKKKVLENKKIILKKDNPTLTYQYLINICANFIFDFDVLEFMEEREPGEPGEDLDFSFSTSSNTYKISGEASIKSLYFFISQIENQPPFYMIESIRLNEESVVKTDTVRFTITLNSYYKESGINIKDIPLKSLKFTNLRYNPFYSRIHEPLLDEYELQFLDIYTSTMVGLTSYKVFLRDENGKINTLAPGDKVAYGYLDHINWDKQAAVFKINLIGIFEEKIIYIDEEAQ